MTLHKLQTEQANHDFQAKFNQFTLFVKFVTNQLTITPPLSFHHPHLRRDHSCILAGVVSPVTQATRALKITWDPM